MLDVNHFYFKAYFVSFQESFRRSTLLVLSGMGFSGHMINEKTQVVCMEEWTSDSLSCEDAKRILQGMVLYSFTND